jgi:hypothetical protein
MFRLDEEMVTFSSMTDLRDKAHYYLNHDAERSAIANRAFIRVNREHTVENRMQEMLLHIFTDRLEGLKSRFSGRQQSPLQFFIEQAEEGSDLQKYLNDFPQQKDFSLKTAVDHISQGKGALTDNEIVMMMLDHVVDEKY